MSFFLPCYPIAVVFFLEFSSDAADRRASDDEANAASFLLIVAPKAFIPATVLEVLDAKALFAVPNPAISWTARRRHA